jgi:hypothetical protein
MGSGGSRPGPAYRGSCLIEGRTILRGVDRAKVPLQMLTFPKAHDRAATILRLHSIENRWRDRLSRYWVYVDSVKRGWVRWGDVGEFRLEPGEHRVWLKYSGFLSSKEIVVASRLGEVVELRCGPGEPALLAPFYWILKPHQTISLELAGTSQA